MGVESIEGTYIASRIDNIVDSEASKPAYKPKTTTSTDNSSYYTPEQINFISK
jgi:hypothetical protein